MSLFFALFSLVGWGVGDVFITIAARKLGGIRAYFAIILTSFALSSFYLPFAPLLTDVPMILFTVAISIVMMVSILAYYRALEIGNASLVGAVVGSFSALVVIFSSFLYHEPISGIQWMGILLTLAGVGLVSFDWSELKKTHIHRLIANRGLQLALFSAFIWGIYFTLVKIPAERIGWFWPTYLRFALFPLIFLYARGTSQKVSFPLEKRIIMVIFAAVVLITIGEFGYNLGILHGFVSVVAPVAGSSPVLFVLLSRFVFKDRLTRQQGVGMVATLVGIIILSLSMAG